MTYMKALKQAFVGLVTSWARIPDFWDDAVRLVKDGAYTLGALALLIFGPLLAFTISPLFALLILADERKRRKDAEKATARFRKARGQRHQGLGK